MAKYDITYTCGCKDTVELVGKTDARYRKIEWMQSRECPACQCKTAQAASAEAGLPALRGSEKQIAWAEQIRAQKLPELEKTLAELKRRLAKIQTFNSPEGKTKMMEGTGKSIAEIEAWFAVTISNYESDIKLYAARVAETRAAWWIENR